MVDALTILGLPNGVCLTSSTSSSTRISLATAGLFVSDESGAEDEKDDEKRLCGLGTGLMQCTSNATKLMQLERYEGIALSLLPQPPATVRDSSGGWVPDVMVGRQLRSSSAVPNLHLATGPVGLVGSGSNLGSRPSSRPPSMCGSVCVPSRAASPVPSNAMVLGAKEPMVHGKLAVLAMLQQGIDLVCDHMASRVTRRLDDAHVRMHALETRFSSLRSAIRFSLSAARHGDGGGGDNKSCTTQNQHTCLGQGQQKDKHQNKQQQGSYERISLSAAPTNRMQAIESNRMQANHSERREDQIEARSQNSSSTRLPELAPLKLKTQTTESGSSHDNAGQEEQCNKLRAAPPPPTTLWGGALVELECQDSETAYHLATVSVSVEASWNEVREAVFAQVHRCGGRLVQGLRFADGSGGSIGLNTESSWVLCKALRSLKASVGTIISCVMGEDVKRVTTQVGVAEACNTEVRNTEARNTLQPPSRQRPAAHVTFKSSPMSQGRGASLWHDEQHSTECDEQHSTKCTSLHHPSPTYLTSRKKRMSDMQPPPMKHKIVSRKTVARNTARPIHCEHPSGPSPLKVAKKKVRLAVRVGSSRAQVGVGPKFQRGAPCVRSSCLPSWCVGCIFVFVSVHTCMYQLAAAISYMCREEIAYILHMKPNLPNSVNEGESVCACVCL